MDALGSGRAFYLDIIDLLLKLTLNVYFLLLHEFLILRFIFCVHHTCGLFDE